MPFLLFRFGGSSIFVCYTKDRNRARSVVHHKSDSAKQSILDCSVSSLVLGNVTDSQLFSNVIQTDFSGLTSLASLTVASQSLVKIRSFSFSQSPLSVILIGSESLQKTKSIDLGGKELLDLRF